MLPKLVITDIDGVWTDGGMYYTSEGDVMKRFSVKDGWGVAFLHQLNIPIAIMTGENTMIVKRRAEKLKIDYCYLGVKDKVETASQLCNELGITLQDVAFIGDDINDLKLLKLVGFSASPQNTPEYIKREVNYVCLLGGGYGAFREFVEKILADNNLLDTAITNILEGECDKNRYNREYTPEMILELDENEIFVFGSNLAGQHGGGAARIAYNKFGAVWGVGVGLQGQCYAIPTMQGGVETILPYVDEFVEFAKSRPDLKFLVTRIGCGIAGFKDETIAKLFCRAVNVPNIILPESFVRYINQIS